MDCSEVESDGSNETRLKEARCRKEMTRAVKMEGQKIERERGRRRRGRGDWVVRPISLQLREHRNINLRANSPPLSTEIANKVQYVRECGGIWYVAMCVFGENIVELRVC